MRFELKQQEPKLFVSAETSMIVVVDGRQLSVPVSVHAHGDCRFECIPADAAFSGYKLKHQAILCRRHAPRKYHSTPFEEIQFAHPLTPTQRRRATMALAAI